MKKGFFYLKTNYLLQYIYNVINIMTLYHLSGWYLKNKKTGLGVIIIVVVTIVSSLKEIFCILICNYTTYEQWHTQDFFKGVVLE